MKSYLNFFWCGNVPSRKQIENLKNWEKHGNSNIIVQLFCPYVLICTLNEKNYLEKNNNVFKFKNSNIHVVDFNTLLFKYELLYPNVVEFYKKQMEYKNFAFVSDLARLIISNDFPGLYFDIDISPVKMLPISLYEIKEKLDSSPFPSANYPYYLNCHNLRIENQCILTFVEGSFTTLLQHLNLLLDIEELNILENEIKDFEDYKNREDVLALKKSFFNDNHFIYLKAYLNKNAALFRKANRVAQLSIENKYPALEMMYQQTVYHMVKNFVNKNVSIHLMYEKYEEVFKKEISCYFYSSQDTLKLFNWANPGYSRLNSLSEAVSIIEKFYCKKINNFSQSKSMFKTDDFHKTICSLKIDFSHLWTKNQHLLFESEKKIFQMKYKNSFYFPKKAISKEIKNLNKLKNTLLTDKLSTVSEDKINDTFEESLTQLSKLI